MEILYVLLVLLLVTRVFGELAERFGQPALVGELTSGILIGVLVGQFSDTFPVLAGLDENEVFVAITELGVFFLMLLAGLEMKPNELAQSSRSALLVAVGGLVLPFAGGFGLAWAMLPDSELHFPQALFLGTALSITAVPVAVRILMDLGHLRSRVGRIIVSAAVFDDVISLILLAVLTGVLKTGTTPGGDELLLLAGKVAVLFAVTTLVGLHLFPRVGRLVKRAKVDELEFTFVLLVGLAFAVLAEALDLHFLLGAFAAGLFFGRHTIDKQSFQHVKDRVSGVSTGFLAPVFFASIGLHMDLGAVTGAPLFLILIVVIGVAGKLIGCGGVARACGLSTRESAAVGFAMSARGAVEVIIADIALRHGLFAGPEPRPPAVKYMFSAVVIMALATTLLAPLALRLSLSRRAADEERAEEAP